MQEQEYKNDKEIMEDEPLDMGHMLAEENIRTGKEEFLTSWMSLDKILIFQRYILVTHATQICPLFFYHSSWISLIQTFDVIIQGFQVHDAEERGRWTDSGSSTILSCLCRVYS